jgi:hypothetical protein
MMAAVGNTPTDRVGRNSFFVTLKQVIHIKIYTVF